MGINNGINQTQIEGKDVVEIGENVFKTVNLVQNEIIVIVGGKAITFEGVIKPDEITSAKVEKGVIVGFERIKN